MMPNFLFPYFNNNEIGVIQNKQWVYESLKQYMYLRLVRMFKYKNLPDTIPENIFSLMLLNGGFAVITDKPDGTLRAFQGGLGGEPDEYYRPTICIVSNPALNFSSELEIGKDCAIIRNDAFMIGLDPLLSRYTALMAENIITMRTVDVLLRLIGMISAPDDRTRESAEEFLRKLERGELGVISENRFFDGIDLKSASIQHSSYITQFIELHQYYKGSLFNELGLQANFNMKRESIGKGEASLSEDILMPLCESMLETRRNDFQKFNEMYGQNVEVDFDSAWLNNQKEQFYELKEKENEAEDNSQLGNDAGDNSQLENDAGDNSQLENQEVYNNENREDRKESGEESIQEDESRGNELECNESSDVSNNSTGEEESVINIEVKVEEEVEDYEERDSEN